MTVGIVAFVVALLVSVMLHEAGHFYFARRFGMKATQFFVGFGPTLWSRRRGETEYGVKAIPAGGFVKIVGMTELEDVAEEDRPRAFYRQPARQRAVVLAAGSVTHFLIAFVLLYLVFVGLGTPALSTTVRTVSPCAPATATAECAPGDEASPAARAGLRPGDRIVAFDGTRVEEWEPLTDRIRAAGDRAVTLGVERDGREVDVEVDLVARERPSRTDPSRTETVGVLGVSPAQVTERANPIEGLVDSAGGMWALTKGTFQGLAAIPTAIPDLVAQTFGGEERSAEGLVGPVGIARASGQVIEAEAPLAQRIASFLLVIAGLNVFVGIFNLLPLLPLDGGHLAVLGFESARSRIYRALGRPDPGRVDLTRLLPAAYLFLVLLIGLSVLLLAADIVNPVQLPL